LNKISLILKIILTLLIIAIVFIDSGKGLRMGIAVVFFSVLIIDGIYDNKRVKGQSK
jgi:hypothetical protein